MMILNHEAHFRFPLLEAIENDEPSFDPNTKDAPEDQHSTTTSKKKSIYDQIIISKGSYTEFPNSPQLGTDVGIVAFDNDTHYEWFVSDWHKVTRMLSNHRPVWIRLRIDLPDDDQ